MTKEKEFDRKFSHSGLSSRKLYLQGYPTEKIVNLLNFHQCWDAYCEFVMRFGLKFVKGLGLEFVMGLLMVFLLLEPIRKFHQLHRFVFHQLEMPKYFFFIRKSPFLFEIMTHPEFVVSLVYTIPQSHHVFVSPFVLRQLCDRFVLHQLHRLYKNIG